MVRILYLHFSVINVQLSKPQIYIHCSKQIIGNTSSHLNTTDIRPIIPSNKWVLLKSRIREKSSLKANIPRGRQTNYLWVSCGTIALSWIVMIYFVRTVVHIPKRLGIVAATVN